VYCVSGPIYRASAAVARQKETSSIRKETNTVIAMDVWLRSLRNLCDGKLHARSADLLG
jgi:hypothetical protein